MTSTSGAADKAPRTMLGQQLQQVGKQASSTQERFSQGFATRIAGTASTPAQLDTWPEVAAAALLVSPEPAS